MVVELILIKLSDVPATFTRLERGWKRGERNSPTVWHTWQLSFFHCPISLLVIAVVVVVVYSGGNGVWFCFRSKGLAKKVEKEKEEQKKQSTGDKDGVARDHESL